MSTVTSGLVYIQPTSVALTNADNRADPSAAQNLSKGVNVSGAIDILNASNGQFDNIQLKNGNETIDLSKTGDTYLPGAQIGKTTDTVAGAPPTAASLAQAASIEAGDPTTVNGSVHVNADAAAANTPWYEQPYAIVIGAAIFGLIGLHMLKGK